MESTLALKKLIEEKVILHGYKKDEQNDFEQGSWIFDFRNVLLNPQHLKLITNELYEKIKGFDNFQIGGLESASIPLISSLLLTAYANGKRVNGFYIRKSRKKSGLYKSVEGTLTDDPVVLVDDVMNSSGSILKQIEILKALGKKVIAVLVIVRYRDTAFYDVIASQKIQIINIFTLADFGLSLSSHTLDQNVYLRRWVFKPKYSSHFLVVSRPAPVLYHQEILFGADDGYFRAINKNTGTEKWSVKMGRSSRGKSILSTPLVHNEVVFFGSYDGKLYALNVKNGSPKWVFKDCDWIGSSPALFEKGGSIIVGLEHADPTQNGSVVSLDIQTGKKNWEYKMSAFTHASPLVIEHSSEVVFGGNEGVLYMLNVVTGELKWKFETEGGKRYLGVGGFSPGDIKSVPSYDSDYDQIAVSSMDGFVYVINRADGSLRYRLATEYADTRVRCGVYSAPVFYGNYLIFAALDKVVYCHDKNTGALCWKIKTSGRIFSTPRVRDGIVYIGSNDGGVYEIECSTGILRARRQFPERIVSPVVFDDEQKSHMYVVGNSSTLYAVTLVI